MARQDKKAPEQEPVPVQPEPVEVKPISPAPTVEPAPVKPVDLEPEGDEPLSLVESDSEDGMSKIRARRGRSALDDAKKEFARQLNTDGTGATRCRIFHSRIAEAPLGHMQNVINEWLDSEQIEVKHIGHVIGILEGKNPEPNLIAMVWY